VHKIGILHPGQMGISVAATAQNSDHAIYWTSDGRSDQTCSRAEEFNLIDTGSLESLCDTCDAIVVVCPPHAAEGLADRVIACSYRGLYLDANAISPQRAQRIGDAMLSAGITFVDGGIIGGPAWEPGRTWLYLSGEGAEEAADLFASGPLETAVVGKDIGKASALKMCYAAYTKGSTALLSAILATAEELGVRGDLEGQWSRDWDGFVEQTRNRVRRVTAKAWRFTGEMDEISATFEGAGLPGGFHAAAGEIYLRMTGFKDADSVPELENVLKTLVRK